MGEFFIAIDYDVIGNKTCYHSNIKKKRLKDVLLDYIRLQMGKGSDETPREEHDLYEITIYLDLAMDRFSSQSNCGNKGLRDGIIMYLIKGL